MEFIRGIQNIQPHHGPCVATIGNFDGVHVGHQQLLQQLVEQSQQLGLPATVIIFEPQPNEYFAHKPPVARLTRLREKLPLLAQAGVDQVLALRFDDVMAQLPAKDFIEHILVEKLQVKCLMLGDDFRFGYQRQGDFQFAVEMGKQLGFEVQALDTIQRNGVRVSSTAVRAELEQGHLSLAEKLLGRPYGMYGRVAHGDKRGRLLGFPTANLYLHRKLTPITGVYCVKVYGLEPGLVYGVANVGNRPTVDGTRSLLEVHLFDFQQEIYGQYIRVDFIHKLRDEKRYDSFELLKQQIFKDAEQAREYFGINDDE